jgi:hypothetical protein
MRSSYVSGSVAAGEASKMKREATVVLISIVHQADAFEHRERYQNVLPL